MCIGCAKPLRITLKKASGREIHKQGLVKEGPNISTSPSASFYHNLNIGKASKMNKDWSHRQDLAQLQHSVRRSHRQTHTAARQQPDHLPEQRSPGLDHPQHRRFGCENQRYTLPIRVLFTPTPITSVTLASTTTTCSSPWMRRTVHSASANVWTNSTSLWSRAVLLFLKQRCLPPTSHPA